MISKNVSFTLKSTNKKIFSKLFLSALFVSTSLVAKPYTALSEAVNEKDFEAQFEKYATSKKGQEILGKAVESYFKELQNKNQQLALKKAQDDVEEQFKNPVKIDPGSSPAKGPENAKITIIEFSDFECPFCKRGKSTIDEVLKNYPNDVRLVFKNLPLPMHEQAKPAAQASLAAFKQGKFWEFHDALFANQESLGKDFYEKTAKDLNLDIEKFKKDSASEEINKTIEADSALGAKNQIQGTPGFFINGIAVKGAYPFEYFKNIIDRILKDKK